MAKIIDEEYWNNRKEPTKLDTFLNKLLGEPEVITILIMMALSIVAFFWAYFLVILTTEDFLRSISVYGQFNLEFGLTEQNVNAILTEWGSVGCSRMIIAVCANFVIMAVYMIIFISLIILVTRLFKEKKKIQNLGLKMIFLPILAGIFNVIGNILMIVILLSGSSVLPFFPLILSISGIVKYGLIISSLIVVIFEIVLYIILYLKSFK